MFFNSFQFAFFLPIVLLLYWIVGANSKVKQNYILIAASYYFYSCWDYRFLFLLIFSTSLSYFSAIQIEKSTTPSARKFWLWLCVIVSIGFLGIFKYYNFFASTFSGLLNSIGLHSSPLLLKIILPVGISFYTFHGLSYSIDIYYKRIKAERNIVDYSLFVSYFPLLVAGPIERATHLLPQLKVPRKFDYEKTKEGIYQIIWGLVKKVVIADTCSMYANAVFDHYHSMNSLSLILGAIYFAFQIYGDFSGYSDIALGTSKLFGIDLLKNFDFPYFSRDIAEFWRKWHISLSSWFRDYVYIPLGGSKGTKLFQIRNVFVIFLLSGFWHGANWTFIVWGLLNALYFIPLLLLNKNRTNLTAFKISFDFTSFKIVINIVLTFTITCFSWIFFRAKTIQDALAYIKRMVTNLDFTPQYFNFERYSYELLFMLLFFVMVEWHNRYKIEPLSGKFSWIKISLSIMAILALGVFTDYKNFIYFQF
ncbi:MBOAT family O-acyltransferase [Flavobacterium sp.]|uniref:MBOAT family O-acyltransferase n=1 Tax=Flavobacterium sp. TaxID=239 RepID=UPI0025DFAD03|nr:MBOAT family O-acyltransferase [Flavobacterium sp.]